MEKLRASLKEFMPYGEAKIIRKQLRDFGIKNYKQKYSDTEHMGFIKRHRISIETMHPQESNCLYYYKMFSVITQHIYADTIEELFDKAIDVEN